MESSPSPDLLRSLALSITYALHKPKTPANLQRKKSLRFVSPSSRPASAKSESSKVPGVTLGIEMLRLYASVLCDPLDPAPLRKFAKAVTNKWLLYLMCEDDPEIVVLATKILARLLVVHGSGYSKKFAEKSGGYIILEYRLKRWWNVPALWPICLSIFFGRDIAMLDVEKPLDRSGLVNMFLAEGDVTVVFPDMLPVIVNMMKSGIRHIIVQEGETSVGGEGLEGRASSCEKSKMGSLKWNGKLLRQMTVAFF
jgi:hypothetical protein